LKKGKTGIDRIVAATIYSWKGFVAAYKFEAAFRQELLIAIVGFVLAIFLSDNSTEFLLLVVPLLLILLAEMVNSAIESAIDRFGGEQHELSARAKDMGSATVFVALSIATLSWVMILGEKYLFS
jgi:diacylglycerol kinase (ATP)